MASPKVLRFIVITCTLLLTAIVVNTIIYTVDLNPSVKQGVGSEIEMCPLTKCMYQRLQVRDYTARCGNSEVFDSVDKALHTQAGKDKSIWLAGIVTPETTVLALNLHLTAVIRNSICNALFLTLDRSILWKIKHYKMPLLVGTVNDSLADSRRIRFKDTERIMLKYKVIHSALSQEMSVFVSDLDVYFKSSPFANMTIDDDYDMMVLSDTDLTHINAGMLFFRPTPNALRYVQHVLEELPLWKKGEQRLLNHIAAQNTVSGIKILALPQQYFCAVQPVGRQPDTAGCIAYHANMPYHHVYHIVTILLRQGMWEMGHDLNLHRQCMTASVPASCTNNDTHRPLND